MDLTSLLLIIILVVLLRPFLDRHIQTTMAQLGQRLITCHSVQRHFASWYNGWSAGLNTSIYKWSSPLLPVELTSFTAQSQGQTVILNWVTATELNNRGFEIQRKIVEGNFATVGFVKGEGTTTNQKEYSYVDKNLTDGKYFYRLKQLDFNGEYEYSKTIEVEVRSLE